MSRWARPDNFGHPVRNPLLRKHVVYRAYNAVGELLYLGCSHNPEERMRAHKSGSEWYDQMRHLRIAGPYNYEVARELEAEGLRAERPIYGFHPDRRTLTACYQRVFNRRFAELEALGSSLSWSEAVAEAARHAAVVTGYSGNNREPLRMTDLTLAAALRAERLDREAAA